MAEKRTPAAVVRNGRCVGCRYLAKPIRYLAAGGFASYAMDVRTIDTEVVQFAGAHAAEFGNGLTILAPVVKRACQVHVITPFLGFVLGGRSSLAPP